MLCWFFLKKNEWLTPIILVFFLHGKTYASHFFTHFYGIAFLHGKTYASHFFTHFYGIAFFTEKLTTSMQRTNFGLLIAEFVVAKQNWRN